MMMEIILSSLDIISRVVEMGEVLGDVLVHDDRNDNESEKIKSISLPPQTTVLETSTGHS